MRGLFHLMWFGCLAHGGEMRSWTDVQDRKVEARMLGFEGGAVILELKDGRKVLYPLERISAADVDYAKSQRRNDKPPEGGKTAANFDAPWPDRIEFRDDPEIAIVEEDAGKKRFVYESANYRYTSDVRLSKSVVKGFAVMFEATHLFCRTLPLAIDGGDPVEGKLPIRLFEKFEDYVAAGGPPSSAGVFVGGQGVVMVPLTSLGVRPVGGGYMLDRDKSSKTLLHELTHQLTPSAYFRTAASGWFSEGLAEYVAVTPYRAGAFSVRNNYRDIVAYVTEYGSKNMGGKALGKEITLPDLRTFMLQNYGSFKEQARRNYGGGLLITYYFLQMDGDGDAKRIKAFLRALRTGESRDESLKVLLDGRTFEELEADITKAWKRRGVELIFAPAG